MANSTNRAPVTRRERETLELMATAMSAVRYDGGLLVKDPERRRWWVHGAPGVRLVGQYPVHVHTRLGLAKKGLIRPVQDVHGCESFTLTVAGWETVRGSRAVPAYILKGDEDAQRVLLWEVFDALLGVLAVTDDATCPVCHSVQASPVAPHKHDCPVLRLRRVKELYEGKHLQTTEVPRGRSDVAEVINHALVVEGKPYTGRLPVPQMFTPKRRQG